jgi:hypothetical protein
MRSGGSSDPTEVLTGWVERVTFHNEDTGFCVLRVKLRGQRELTSVVGHAASIAAGEFMQATGRVTGSWGCAVHKDNLGRWRTPIVMKYRSTSCGRCCAE